MFTRIRIAAGFALIAILITAIPVFAGGWAVITLDELPGDVAAGEPLTIGFTVRQHGITLMDGLYPTVTARLPDGEQFVVDAEQDDKPGHYTATLIFPKDGKWEWSIQAFSMDQPMPALNVTAAAVPSTNEQASKVEAQPVSRNLLLVLRALLFGVALVGLAIAVQRKSRVTGALTALCLVVGIITFMVGGVASEVEAQGKEASEAAVASSPAQVEMGRQLFLAKGCITCHYNSRAAGRDEYWTIEMGAPDLSNYSSHPEVLFIRLKDPAAAKSDTKMPDLGLKETEIKALIAFINSK
jgi:mono/diheme cytochrome c family protein